MAAIHIVLHGGLGNQLFQYFIGKLEQTQHGGGTIALHTELLQHYSAARGLELNPLLAATNEQHTGVRAIGLLARARLPKLLARMRRGDRVLRLPGWGSLVDGYFQFAAEWVPYGTVARDRVLQDWQRALSTSGLLRSEQASHITHLRLGDFFKTPGSARAFASEKILAIPANTDVITDQENLIEELIAELAPSKKLNVVPTAALGAWELLRMMSGYQTITTNGSSLAFWAAVLGRRTLVSSNADHMVLWRELDSPGLSLTPCTSQKHAG